MPILTEQKSSKVQSIFSGNVSLDKVMKEGESILRKETGQENVLTEDSIFAGIFKAQADDMKESTKPVAEKTGSIFTGISQAVSDLRRTLFPNRGEELARLQEEAQQTFTPQEAQRRLVEEEQKQGLVSPSMFRPVETQEDFEKFLGEKRFDPLFTGTLERVSGKVAAPIFKGFKDLTTQFLNHIKGKQFVSRQEILDFAKRPELKKGEADDLNLLIKKLDEFDDTTPKQKAIENLQKTSRATIDDIEYLRLQDNALKDFVQNETGKRTLPDNIDWGNLQGHSEYGSPLTDKTYKWLDNYLRERKVQNPTDDILMELSYFVPDRPIKLYRGGEMNRNIGGVKVNSWTHDVGVAGKFAGKNGKIYEAIVDPGDIVFDSKMVNPNYDIPTFSNWEDEVLVMSRVKGNELSFSGKYPAGEIANALRFGSEKYKTRGVLELKPVKVKEPQYARTTIEERSPTMERTTTGVRRSIGGKNYEEVVFESPITTNGSSHYPNFKKYFAHIRGDEIIEWIKGKLSKIWREQEIQSDLLQKDILEDLGFLKGDRIIYKGKEYSVIGRDTNSVDLKRGTEEINVLKIEFERPKFNQLFPFTNDRFGERIMRERIKEKAGKGYEKYRLPTGETIGKIEGFREGDWYLDINTALGRNAEVLAKVEDLIVGQPVVKFGEKWIITDILEDGRFKAVPKSIVDGMEKRLGKSFDELRKTGRQEFDSYEEIHDLTGKSNPQYRRYSDWGKFLKNKFGGKEVTDPQGNSWMEIDLRKEMSKEPTLAFGKTNIGTMLGIGGTLGATALAAPLFSRKNEFEVERDKVIPIKGRGVSVNSQTDANSLGATLFGELSNTENQKEEARQILNTILNRAKKTGKSVRGVVKQPNQYQAFGGKEFKKYLQGDLDEPSRKKAEIVNEVLQELFSGSFEDNTGGAFYYHHDKKGKIILDKNKPLFK